MNIIEILIPVFLVFGLGALSVASKVFSSDDSYVFSKYNYYFGLPILIFFSLYQTDFEKIGDLNFLAANLLNLIVTVLILLLISKVFKFQRKFTGMLVFAGILGNVAYMGIPLNELLFGTEGVGFASIIVGLVVAFSLSIGIFFLELFSKEKPNLKNISSKLLKNPLIIAIVLGILASGINLPFPVYIENFFQIVSKSAGPIALFSIGMFLVGKHLVKDRGKVFALVCANLILLPIITYGVGLFFGLGSIPFKVSILQAAMPLAATTFVIAQEYKIMEETISNAIVVSTLLSIFTLGITMSLFNSSLAGL